MPTARRSQRVVKVLSQRQPDLRIVLEGITIAHNTSAVIRTCDAAGVLHIDIISPNKDPLPINRAISTRAEKWVALHHYHNTADCLKKLKSKGLKLAVACLEKKARLYTELDYTQPLAIVFGNESEGLSDEALRMADEKITIPMLGMVQSLNLSVSVGIILYEALKQRLAKGFYEKTRLSSKEFDNYLKKWLARPPKKT